MNLSTSILAPSILLLAGVAHAGSTMNVPADFATIQEAVTAAAPGDTIVVESGWYRENVTIVTSGITLRGKKVTIDGAYAGTCLTVQADDVTLTGLIFANGGAPSADGSDGGGLDYVGSGAVISECTARGSAGFGIRLTGTGEVEDCTVSGALGTGLVVDTAGGTDPLTMLRNNSVYRSAAGIEARTGPFVFDRNVASNNSGDGMRLEFLAGSSNGTPPQATELKHGRSLGNGGTGLLVNDETGAVTLIEKFEISFNAAGLDLTSSTTGLQVSNSKITQNRAGGVFLRTTGATFHGNRVGRNSLVGILVQSAGGASDGGNLLAHNTIEANGGDGIHAATGANLVHFNFLKNNTGDGLQVASGAHGNSFVGNTVRESGHDGIDNSGTSTLVSDNTTKDNDGADLAGIGDGTGTLDPASTGNSVKDGTDATSPQELELDTLG